MISIDNLFVHPQSYCRGDVKKLGNQNVMSLHYNVFEKYMKCSFKEKALTFPIEKLLSAKFKAAISIQTQVPLSCLVKEIVSKPFQAADASIPSIVLDGGVEFMVLLNAQDSMMYRCLQRAKY
jgi:hypothetical protein